MTTRQVNRISTATPILEGAGVHLNRAFANADAELFDPFLLLDDFRSDTPEHYLKGFPWHPHRGIETITYVIKGDVEHGDSLGNKGEISCGDVQWMTAGSGIIHQEMPKGDAEGRMHGFQLWANLPAVDKMMPPRYRDIKASEIPSLTLDSGATLKVICGRIGDVHGPVEDVQIAPEYLDVCLPAGTSFVHPTPKGHSVFAYVHGGVGCFDEESKDPCGNRTLILFGDGEQISVTAGDEELRFLLVSGKPLREPIAWGGPIVMNTREELELAFKEFQNGNFLKHQDG